MFERTHHKLVWTDICSEITTCILYGPFLIHDFSSTSNTKGVTSGTYMFYPSWAPEFTPIFIVVDVAHSLVFFVMFSRSWSAFFLWSYFVYLYSIYGFWLSLWYFQTFIYDVIVNWTVSVMYWLTLLRVRVYNTWWISALRSKNINWLSLCQNNVSEWTTCLRVNCFPIKEAL
jgi:hypothetical protein